MEEIVSCHQPNRILMGKLNAYKQTKRNKSYCGKIGLEFLHYVSILRNRDASKFILTFATVM